MKLGSKEEAIGGVVLLFLILAGIGLIFLFKHIVDAPVQVDNSPEALRTRGVRRGSQRRNCTKMG